MKGGLVNRLVKAVPTEAVFTERCEARALLFANAQLSLHDAVDELQAYAEQSSLVARLGQDEVQRIMAAAFHAVRNQEDDGLDEAFEREIMLRTADLVRQWELDDPRDRWKHTGEAPPKAMSPQVNRPKAYETPEATINAFWYVVSLCEPKRLTAWLDDHPRDGPFLIKLLEDK